MNCTLKPPGGSHTQGLTEIALEILRRNEVTVDVIQALDHDIPPGVYPDMTDHGWELVPYVAGEEAAAT